MSASEATTFVVALFSVDGHRFAVDVTYLVDLGDDDPAALDPARLLSIARPPHEHPRSARFAWGDRRVVMRLGERVDVVTVNQAAVFALPPIVDTLASRALLGLVQHDGELFTVLDPQELDELDRNGQLSR